ncbi:MAG: FAD-dependent oxidoreductase [Erysipelotrichaceae bacterium]|nr:FAD-dependent oxidoreductase [Erysipelotrichaceae bacterium]
MNKYAALKQPYMIGNVTIPNRFTVIPMTMGALAYDEGGGFSDNLINYFELRAKGGFGLIIPGAAGTDYHVDPYSALGPNVITNKHWQERAKVLTDTIHRHDTKIFCQLTMGLGRNYPGLPGPSENPVWRTPGQVSPELTKEQIRLKINDVVEGAMVAKECGYDGVEIHAMHWGYLLDQMAMAFYNRREDEYGGSLENRLRCAKEIVEGIHEKCGRDFPVGMRLGLKTFIKDYDKATLTGEEEVGRTLEEGVEISKLLESYGYDFLDVDTGTYDSFYYACPPMYNPQGFMIPLAAKAKAVVKIPVIAGGRMQDYDLALEAIEKDEIDAVGLGRPSLADPDYPNKVFNGETEKIRPCIGCNMGCFRRCVETGEPVSCAVNPQAARELVLGLKAGEGNKKVVVVGGGVAGMEAARTAALRGYRVTLFEKSDHLGGHIVEAGAHEFKHEIRKLNEWYQRELKDLGVDIKLEHEPCINCIRKQEADVIILATGTNEAHPPIPGLEKALPSLDAIDHPEKIGTTVIVAGGGLVGCEIALDEAKKGKDVMIVEALDDIMAAGGASAPYPNKQMIVDLFEHYGVKVYTSTRLSEVAEEGAIVEKTDGSKELLKADTIISALGFKPTPNLKEEWAELNLPMYEIGDATGAGTILKAIWDAYEVANSI